MFASQRLALAAAFTLLGGGLVAVPTGLAGDATSVLSGVVVAVDLDGRTLTVKDPKAGSVVVHVTEKAVIVLDGDEQAVLEDVFEGDVVESATLRDAGQGKPVLVKAVISTAPEEDEEDPVEPAPEAPAPAPPKRP
jgi:hypothetical protein